MSFKNAMFYVSTRPFKAYVYCLPLSSSEKFSLQASCYPCAAAVPFYANCKLCDNNQRTILQLETLSNFARRYSFVKILKMRDFLACGTVHETTKINLESVIFFNFFFSNFMRNELFKEHREAHNKNVKVPYTSHFVYNRYFLYLNDE